MLPRKQEQMHVQCKIKNSEALDETTYTENESFFSQFPTSESNISSSL